MKKSVYVILLAIALMTAFNSCNTPASKSPAVESKAEKQVIYTCTMHPEIRSNKPGECPKCGMELVKMEHEENSERYDSSDTIQDN